MAELQHRLPHGSTHLSIFHYTYIVLIVMFYGCVYSPQEFQGLPPSSVIFHGELPRNSDQFLTPPTPWIRPNLHGATATTKPSTPPPCAEHWNIQYTGWPRIWDIACNPVDQAGELQPNDPSRDKYPRRDIMQEPPGILCRMFYGSPQRVQRCAGGCRPDHKGESVGMVYIIHSIP